MTLAAIWLGFSRNMAPSPTAGNLTNSGSANAERLSDGFERFPFRRAVNNLQYLKLQEFMTAMFRTLLHVSFEHASGMQRILSTVNPFQILWAVVKFYAIPMVAKSADIIRRNADECNKNKTVNHKTLSDAVSVKANAPVSAGNVSVENLATDDIADVSAIANLIDSLVSKYRQPRFNWHGAIVTHDKEQIMAVVA